MAQVLLVGATSTVATKIAEILVKRGDQLYCVGRSVNKMQKLRALLGEGIIGDRCFDFVDYGLIHETVDEARQVLGRIDLVLIAHGDLTDQLQSEEDLKSALHTYEANLLSVVAFLIPVMKVVKAQGGGKIGVITSVAGDRGRPRNFTYGSAKGAVSLYLQGLRSVCWRTGIEIYDFKLGPVDTPMSATHEKNFSFSMPEKVAQLIVGSLGRRRYTVYVPGFWRWVMFSVRWMPEWLFQRLGFLSDR